jgi:hypothetical protein
MSNIKVYPLDCHEKTSSEIIYEHYRRQLLEKKPINIGIFICSFLLAISTSIIIMYANYNQVDAVSFYFYFYFATFPPFFPIHSQLYH